MGIGSKELTGMVVGMLWEGEGGIVFSPLSSSVPIHLFH